MGTLRLTNICKRFNGIDVLKDISFETTSNEFIAILGPSGCGKTTLLKIIAGIEEPEKGKVFFNNKDITSLPSKTRNIGMVFQNLSVYPHLSVYDNLSLPLKIQKVNKNTINDVVRKIAEQFEIHSLLKRKAAKLSGGEMQRVAIAKNLIKDTELLLMDEPLNNLDANIKDTIKNLIKKIKKEKKITFVYVTHDYLEAMTLADKIIVINNGNIIQIGTPLDIYQKPANLFVAKFIGNPRINIFDITFIELENIFFIESPLGKKIITKNFFNTNKFYRFGGIRPEELRIQKADFFSNQKNIFTIKSIEYTGTVYTIVIEEIEDFKIVQFKFDFLVNDKVVIDFDETSLKLFNG